MRTAPTLVSLWAESHRERTSRDRFACEVRVRKDERSGGGTDGEGLADTNVGSGGAQFFGVESTGRKFVFLVDSSKSMKNGKFEAALYELQMAIGHLGPEQYFYVAFFDWDDLPMFDKENPEPRPLPANPTNLRRLAKWLPTVELELKTTPYASVKRAMEIAMLGDEFGALAGEPADRRGSARSPAAASPADKRRARLAARALPGSRPAP